VPKVAINNHEISYSFNGVSSDISSSEIVLIHGAGGQEIDWPMAWRSANNLTGSMGLTPSNQGVSRLFNAGLDDYSIYAVDLPGHGKSEGKSKLSIDEYSSDIIDFLDVMDLKKVCLVGHSMGAAIALNACLSGHWRICSVVAIGGASKMIVNDAILEGLQDTFEATVDSIVRYSWHKKTGAVADSPQMAAFFREKAKQRMLDAGSKTVFGDFLACSRFDLSKRVGEIVVPVLVIASDCDRMVPLNVSWEMSEVLKNSYFVCLENCGHFQHIEQTGKVAAELVNFLSKIQRASGS
jgi:pimeloyl-ACP methyl ester carboxylesterase